jgi:LemA protein
MKAVLIVLGVLLLAALLIGGKFVGIRNDLVQQREAVNGAWSQVDVALQRRADLIPNLVETVKGFAKQEQEVLNNIANARAALLNARNPQEAIAANSRLDNAIGRLLVVVENYPQLRSNENFLRLQDELAGTGAALQHVDRDVSQQPGRRAVRFHTQRRVFQNRSGCTAGTRCEVLKSALPLYWCLR